MLKIIFIELVLNQSVWNTKTLVEIFSLFEKIKTNVVNCRFDGNFLSLFFRLP